jgi:hypothetical protein
MAYFEFHDTLPDHPKVKHLASLLDVSEVTAVGHFACLLAWTIRFRPGGRVENYAVAGACRLQRDGASVVTALVQAGLAHEDGESIKIHDWREYTRNYLKSKKDARRVQRYRSRTRTGQFADKSGEQNGAEQSGTEQSGEERKSPPSGPAVVLWGYWNSARVGAPIGREKGVRIIQVALDRGMKFREAEAAFTTEARMKGRKIWELLDELAPKGAPGQKSISDMLSKFGGGGC